MVLNKCNVETSVNWLKECKITIDTSKLLKKSAYLNFVLNYGLPF